MTIHIENLTPYIIPPVLSLIVSLLIIIIAVLKMKFKKEHVIFILFCICWSLLSPVFISHQLFRGNTELILRIERTVHFFYAYSPALSLLYFFTAAQIGHKNIVRIAFIISFFISLLTFTPYYIPGLHEYSWGYMAKGGIAFIAFGIYASLVLLYLIYQFIKRIRIEKNQIMLLKMKYILASFLISGILSILNYPAIVGMDIYPPGNFSFIPLAFLAYGVLKYRLLDFSTAFQITTLWAALSAAMALPNLLVIFLAQRFIATAGYGTMIIFGLVFFLLNYQYFKRVQPFIDRLFNGRKIELKNIETDFLKTVYSLKSSEELITEITGTIQRVFSDNRTRVLLCLDDDSDVIEKAGRIIRLSDDLMHWIASYPSVIEKEIAESSPLYQEIRDELIAFFHKYRAQYLLPLIHHKVCIGCIFFSINRKNRVLSPDEMHFLNAIKAAAAVSLHNALLYGALSDIKENLETRVKERTTELENSMNALLKVLDKLEKDDKDRVVSYFNEKKIEDIKDYINANFCEEISRGSIAKMMNLNSDYLGRSFKKITGKSINQYINELRTTKACDLLVHSDKAIIDVAFEAGYESLPTFYRIFKKNTGKTPIQFREINIKL